MRIITNSATDQWEVVASWYDAERVVHSGDLFSCLRFRADRRDDV